METLGERIRIAREVHGLTQEEVAARFGIKRESVAGWEANDSKPKAARLSQLVTMLQCSYDWLLDGKGEPPKMVPFGDNPGPTKNIGFDRSRGERVQIIPGGGPVLASNTTAVLPVYAAAQGGKGHLIVTFEPVDYKAPPAELLTVRGAYGILVVGDSMAPAYEPGDIAWVTPYKPPQRGKDVVLYHGQPTGEAEAMIKRLVNFNDREWHLKQFNPAKEFTESRKDWPVCHQIHSTTNA